MKFISLILSLFLFSPVVNARSYAKPLLENFETGHYMLVKGDFIKCNEGKFEYQAGGTYVMFGAYHGFDVQTQTTLVDASKGGRPCVYEDASTTMVNGETTMLLYHSVKKTEGETVFSLTKKAEVKKGQISMDVVRTGLHPDSYSCVWNKTIPEVIPEPILEE